MNFSQIQSSGTVTADGVSLLIYRAYLDKVRVRDGQAKIRQSRPGGNTPLLMRTKAPSRPLTLLSACHAGLCAQI